MLERIIEALLSQGMTEADARALVESSGFMEAGARHSRADLARLDEVIKLLIVVRDGDASQRERARKALAQRAAGQEPDDDPTKDGEAETEDPPAAEPLEEAAAPSIDQIRDRVAKALSGGLLDGPWPREIYLTALDAGNVIYASRDGTTYRRDFTLTGDAVVLGTEATKVEQVYQPITEAVEGRPTLLEAVEPDGSVVDVLVIEAGTSVNGRRYRPEVLREAVDKFDGARAFAGFGPDHNPLERGVRSLVGWWSNPRYVTAVPDGKGGTTEGVAAHFNIVESADWLRGTVRDAFRRGKRDLIGFSIVGDGPTKSLIEAVGAKRRTVRDVQRIDLIESVDPVIHPAAGGRALRLVASEEDPNMEWGNLTLIEAIKGLATSQFTPEDLQQHRADLFSQISAGRLMEAAPVQPPAPVAPAIDPAAVTAEVSRLVEAALAPMTTQRLVESALSDRRLPAAVADRIRALAAGRTMTAEEVNTLVEGEVAYAGVLNPATVSGAGAASVSAMKDERERFVEGIYDMLAGKSHGSIRETYVTLTGDSQGTGRLQESGRLMESIVTTTFDQIYGEALYKRMLDVYAQPGLDSWRQIAEVTPLRDFRTQHRIRMGGYGNLATVAQGQPYLPLTTPGDEEATFAPTKRGGTEDVTMEAILNDDLASLRQIPVRLGRSAAQTLHEFVWDFLRTNGTVYDSVALAHASHGNLGTSALAANTLAAGRLAMLKQTDMSNGKRLAIRPRTLVVPVDLEQTAYELTQTDREVASANNTLNFVRTFGLNVIVVEYWTDTNNWWLVCDPADAPRIEVGFLNGQEQPELFLQDQPTVGSVFSNDVLTWKIRHIYGGGVLDYRGFYGAIVP